MVINLTLVSGNFSEQLNGNCWGQHKILEERFKNLEFQNQQQESQFYVNQEGDIEGGSFMVGLEDFPVGGLEVRMMLDLYFNFPTETKIFLS